MNSFFLQGLQHPFLTPAHLIVLIALGILLGQQGVRHAVKGLVSLAIFTVVGLFISDVYQTNINIEIVLLVVAGLLGILTAIKLTLPYWSVIVIAFGIGVLIGVDSAPVIIPGLKASKLYLDMAGSFSSIILIPLLVCIAGLQLNRLWQGVILRIFGSWIFASSLMVVAFMFAPSTEGLVFKEPLIKSQSFFDVKIRSDLIRISLRT